MPWINPSPNMRNLHQATLYPGIGAFESTNISVGRGTDTPFEHVGAPWIDGPRLAEALNARQIPGVRFYPVRFTPDRQQVRQSRSARACSSSSPTARPCDRCASAWRLRRRSSKLFPGKLRSGCWRARLFGSSAGLDRIKAGDDPAAIAASWSAGEARWRLLRAKYLIY